MSRKRLSTTRQLSAIIGVAVALGGGIVMLGANAGHAGESCVGLDTALQNNLTFIAGQKRHPNANSEANIANRDEVVKNIQDRRKQAGCKDKVVAKNPDGNGSANGADDGNKTSDGSEKSAKDNDKKSGNRNDGKSADGDAKDGDAKDGDGKNGDAKDGDAKNGNGELVCQGQNITNDGQGGKPGATSNKFKVGDMLKVTNLDNGEDITVPVTGTSGSCVLLNSTAFNKIHEAGKQLIRRATVEKVG
jgi:hypothetical protein